MVMCVHAHWVCGSCVPVQRGFSTSHFYCHSARHFIPCPNVPLRSITAGHPLHEQARALLEANNPNEDKNSGKGLEGLQRRCVAGA